MILAGTRHLLGCCITMIVFLNGCMLYSPSFKLQTGKADPAEVALLLEKAETSSLIAKSKASLWECIAMFEQVTSLDGSNYRALVTLSHLYLLAGDGYEESISKKANLFKKARAYSEQAMYQNSRFREQIDSGEKVWEACRELSVEEVDSIVFWATSVFYYYKECLGPIGQVINFSWIKRARIMLETAESLNAEWGGGIIYLTWGLYYLSVPEAVGGDREKSLKYFAKAIAADPHRLINHWARAKYYHVKMGKRDSFTEDLQWILHQDLSLVNDHMAWRYFYVADAKRLLEQRDRLFK